MNGGTSAPISRRRGGLHKKVRFSMHSKKLGRAVRWADGYVNMNLEEISRRRHSRDGA